MIESFKTIISDYKIANEYYHLAIYLYDINNHYQKKFRDEVNNAIKEINRLKIDVDFNFPEENITIDYSRFDVSIEEIIKKNWIELSDDEFIFLVHYCTGSSLKLFDFNHFCKLQDREDYMKNYGYKYHRIRRRLIIDEILN